MAFNWNEYIKLAEELNQGTHAPEAKMRSATSRAYYGAFIQCRIKSPLANLKIGDFHSKVIDYFRREDGTPEEQTIGINLETLRIQRNKADYDGFYSPNQSLTNNHINLAKSIVKNLNNL